MIWAGKLGMAGPLHILSGHSRHDVSLKLMWDSCQALTRLSKKYRLFVDKNGRKRHKERLGPLDILQTGRCQPGANIGQIIIKANSRSEEDIVSRIRNHVGMTKTMTFTKTKTKKFRC